MNICGCLVHVVPERAESAAREITALDGVEIHGQDQGRFVVVVEDTPERMASDTIMALHNIKSVLSLSLNFHHFEEGQSTEI